MKTSLEGLIFLIGNEGIVLSTYLDSVGVKTIGVGHTKAAGGIDPATFSGTLSMQQAIDLLATDIVNYENAVARVVTVPLKQHEFDAIVSWHFNTGAVGTASWIKKLNAGDRAGAIKGIMDWKKPASIIGRRTAERDLFRDGKYPPPMATVYPVDGQQRVLWSKGSRVNVRDLLSQPKPAIPPEPIMPPQNPPAWVAPAKPSPNWVADAVLYLSKAFRKS